MSYKLFNQRLTTVFGDEFIVLPIQPERRGASNSAYYFHIRFTKTGYETMSDSASIRRGQIRDRLAPSIYGVASLGYASNKDNKFIYGRWFAMIGRCYNPTHKSYPHYGAHGVKVCERWHRFDYFLEDVSKIEGYDASNMDSLHLDKDIKQMDVPKSRRIYSLETCKWVTQSENDSHRVFRDKLPHLRKTFFGIDPDGNKHEITGVRHFAEQNNLNASAISQCMRGRYKSHKGWTFTS